jgi:response regulator RpfG family c-di-GMP phosphodiesterase
MGRVLCIADSFDAMTTDRTYRSARPLPIALAEIRRCAGTQFDPYLAELFVKEDVAALKRHMLDLARSPLCTGDACLDLVESGEGTA